MPGLTPQFQAELAKRGFVGFGAVAIQLPGGTIRLLDGSGRATLFGDDFAGKDLTYGVLGGITEFSDGVDDEAPSLTLTMLPPSNAAMAALADPAAQGSPVMIWVGAIDWSTGEVIPDPDLRFIGEIDVPTERIARNTRALDLTIVSIFERFLEQDEGARLNGGFHQTLYPGELGLQFTSLVEGPEPWGSDAPRPALVTGGPTFTPTDLQNLVNRLV